MKWRSAFSEVSGVGGVPGGEGGVGGEGGEPGGKGGDDGDGGLVGSGECGSDGVAGGSGFCCAPARPMPSSIDTVCRIISLKNLAHTAISSFGEGSFITHNRLPRLSLYTRAR